MATKEQERKALEQIKKIIEGLGKDSYIATAMDGMIEDAEENIENDFAMSWKDRATVAEKRFEDLASEYNKQVCEMVEKYHKISEELELAKQTMNLEAERANKGWARVKELNDQIKEGADLYTEEVHKNNELTMELGLKDNEIIQLKAKLYDLMVK